MCCVGTKNLLNDYKYIIRMFQKSGAFSSESALPLKEIGIDFSEHLFARDQLDSLVSCGEIKRAEGKYYLKNPEKYKL